MMQRFLASKSEIQKREQDTAKILTALGSFVCLLMVAYILLVRVFKLYEEENSTFLIGSMLALMLLTFLVMPTILIARNPSLTKYTKKIILSLRPKVQNGTAPESPVVA